MMDNARITPFRPPVISPDIPREKSPQVENRPDPAPEARNVEPPAAAERPAAPLNPLAALFDHGSRSATVGQKFNQPADGQPVRGRFVDVVA